MKRIFEILILTFLLVSFVTLNNCKEEETELPALVTTEASDITTNSAISGGFIPDDGGAEITFRGLCWGAETNPSISGSITNDGTGMGSFTSSLTGLDQNTLYYARAYATNSEGTAYGNEIQFTTNQAEKPTVATIVKSSDISYYYVRVEIYITNDGGTPLTEKGICWATGENPTIIDNKCINDEEEGFQRYRSVMSPLQPKSGYHVRAYAINSIDISYGNDVLINTLAVPEVTTVPATEITNSSTRVGGNVISFGDASDAETGICYGTDRDPSIEGPHIIASTTGTGEFTCNLTNLIPGTLYYARAYIAWEFDYFMDIYTYIVYGNEVTFTSDN